MLLPFLQRLMIRDDTPRTGLLKYRFVYQDMYNNIPVCISVNIPICVLVCLFGMALCSFTYTIIQNLVAVHSDVSSVLKHTIWHSGGSPKDHIDIKTTSLSTPPYTIKNPPKLPYYVALKRVRAPRQHYSNSCWQTQNATLESSRQ